jgi:hypothetical protein
MLGNGGGARHLWKRNHVFLAKATSWLFYESSFWTDLSLSAGEVGKKEKACGLKDCERHHDLSRYFIGS